MTKSLQSLVKTSRGLNRVITQTLTTYDEFDHASKPQTLRVQDAFAMQLLQIRRMPAESALALSAEYGTMLSLWEQYQKEEDATKRARMLQNVQATEGRKVGIKMSSELATLFSCKNYADAAPTLAQTVLGSK